MTTLAKIRRAVAAGVESGVSGTPMALRNGWRCWQYLLQIVGATSSLSAQMIQGRVLMADSVTGVGGIEVIALDSAGATVARSLSSPSGGYVLRLSAATAYELRALRVGYTPTIVQAVRVDDATVREIDIILNQSPVALPAVAIRGKDRCGVDTADATRLLQLLSESRSALTAAPSALPGGTHRARVIRIDGQMDADGKNREVDSLGARELVNKGLLSDAPFDTLAQAGFLHAYGTGEFAYDLPTPEFIVSDPFIAGHCFHIVAPPAEHSDWIGLGFAPIESRGAVADVAGTLWLKRQAFDPQRLEIKYTNVQHHEVQACDSSVAGIGVMCQSMGSGTELSGVVEFKRSSTGAWIASQSTITTGVVAAKFRELFKERGRGPKAQSCAGGPGCERVSGLVPRLGFVISSVVSLAREGAEIYHDAVSDAVVTRNAKKRAGAHPASVEGRVTDSGGRPLAGAVIEALEPGRAAIANDSGFFTIRVLPATLSTIQITHDGFEPVAFKLPLKPDSARRVAISLVARPAKP